jgi:hypothetical protein
MHERPAFQRHLPQAIAALAALLASAAIFAPAPLESQSPESRTLPFMVQDGLSYAEQRRWGDAINVLEEAWERDPSNPIVAEHLALAYLYERIPPDAEALSKAEGLMRSSLAHGGQVSVFAQHVHGALRKVVGSDDHCSGRLVLSADGVYYSTSLTEHSFSLGLEQLADIVPAKGKQPSSEGGLTLRTRDGKRHSIRTGTLSKSEAEIVLRLTREYLLGG